MIDASIPLGVQTAQFDTPMDHAQRAATLSQIGMQNRFMQSKMDEQQRAATLNQTMQKAYADSGGDKTKFRNTLASLGMHEQVAALDKSSLEEEETRGKIGAQQAALGDKFKASRSDAAQFIASGGTMQHVQMAAQDLKARGDHMAASHLLDMAAQHPDATPEQIRAYVQPFIAQGVSAKDFSTPNMVDTGQQLTDTNPFTKSAPIAKQQTLESLASNQVAREGHAITRRGQDLQNARSLEANGNGKAPLGYRYKPDGNLEAIPGGPASSKNEQTIEANRVRDEGYLNKANLVLDKVDEALNKTGFLTSGLTGKSLSMVPGTGAYDLDKTVETIKANLGFQELAAMRAASPTGGALGAIAVKELEFLQSAVSSLDVGQSEKQQKSNLMKVKRHYEAWKKTIGQKGGGSGASGGWEDL